ncbi:hypothetical protein Pla86_07720 [Planctomycetes bacterium Pla86]|uniref:Uncharacterized protein n=1 Tax=Engelhardtia mirabilis TaxID=2528011 RepID=A0A518BFF0_9BACT|nr:hypothetical protein Pla133_07730 [Planctomycetes bacterium Pla133]QDV00034.1 hypothetical protein Pla86_07720 [Planctomycetes bacterium Pla86]
MLTVGLADAGIGGADALRHALCSDLPGPAAPNQP